MSEGERIEPRTGAKRRERRDDEANFGEADDQGRSLVQDVGRRASIKKPRGRRERRYGRTRCLKEMADRDSPPYCAPCPDWGPACVQPS